MSGAPWSWLGEALPLDFANTVRRVGSTYREHWMTGADVREWSVRQQGRVPRVPVREAEARLGELLRTRDDFLAVLHAVDEGTPLPAGAARRINALARTYPVVDQLPVGSGAPRPRSLTHGSAVDELLGRVAHALIALLNSPEAARLTWCDAPGCGQFFLHDRTDQQWCGTSCGTRARVARHQARRVGHGRQAEVSARRRAR